MPKLTGRLTIARACEVAATLGQMIAEEENGVVLDLSEVTAADVSFIQVLCAAHRSALGEGKSFSVISPSPELVRTVRLAGFERNRPCAQCTGDTCLWQAIKAA